MRKLFREEKKNQISVIITVWILNVLPKFMWLAAWSPKGSIVERYNFKRWGLVGGPQVTGGVSSQENVGS